MIHVSKHANRSTIRDVSFIPCRNVLVWIVWSRSTWMISIRHKTFLWFLVGIAVGTLLGGV